MNPKEKVPGRCDDFSRNQKMHERLQSGVFEGASGARTIYNGSLTMEFAQGSGQTRIKFQLLYEWVGDKADVIQGMGLESTTILSALLKDSGNFPI